MNILIRNLNRNVTEKQLLDLFRPYGEIYNCNLVMDEKTGLSKGFGFVEMPVKKEALDAIGQLNGKVVQGIAIRVKTTNR
jgi:RNA recognition motif-containing protein